MFSGIILGLLIGYILSYFGMVDVVLTTIQPYITFEATAILYYAIFAVLGCVFRRR